MIAEGERFHEVIHGELVREAMPSGRHGRAQSRLSAHLDAFDRSPGGKAPGGWWFAAGTEIELAAHEIVRPDLSGWRREHLAEPPAAMPVRVRPDCVCEVLSPSNARNDRVTKFEVYREYGVPHYWLIDPDAETLTVFRWTAEGYQVTVNAGNGERVAPEPFAAIPLEVAFLFGADPTESHR